MHLNGGLLLSSTSYSTVGEGNDADLWLDLPWKTLAWREGVVASRDRRRSGSRFKRSSLGLVVASRDRRPAWSSLPGMGMPSPNEAKSGSQICVVHWEGFGCIHGKNPTWYVEGLGCIHGKTTTWSWIVIWFLLYMEYMLCTKGKRVRCYVKEKNVIYGVPN